MFNDGRYTCGYITKVYYINVDNKVEFYYKNRQPQKIYKITEQKKGGINWEYVYENFNYDIEFLVNNCKQLERYMSREEKLKVFEYKMRINNVKKTNI